MTGGSGAEWTFMGADTQHSNHDSGGQCNPELRVSVQGANRHHGEEAAGTAESGVKGVIIGACLLSFAMPV